MAINEGPRYASDLMRIVVLVVLSTLVVSCGSPANGVPASATNGKCPVCGMTARSDDPWSAEIYYKDGTKIIFESLGDLLLFYTAPQEYPASESQKDRANVTRTTARDYQSKQVIDARDAMLVYGSKVQGPMGPDFVAFSKKEDAEAFAAANGGRITTFPEVTQQMVKDLRKY